MQSNDYDVEYFRKTRNNVGLLLKTMRPLWWRWLKIIRKYKSSGCLLDVGCGEGYFLQYAERNYDTYGIDVSEYCIREAMRKTNKTKLSVNSIKQIDYKNETFDIITCFDVLEHLEYPETTIKKIGYILKSGGLFVIRVPNLSSLGCDLKKEGWFGYVDKTHLSLLSNQEWFSLLNENDFKIIEVFYDGLWDTPYIKIVPKFIQNIFIKLPSLGLFILGIKYPMKLGENLCIISRRG